ncbi:MAG: oligoendopeptidase F [Caldithrix sp.]|nr:oligoendopeptidase F [Caldithrix sp.]
MKSLLGVLFMLMLLFNQNVYTAEGPDRTREDIPEKYKWNLNDLYQDKQAWKDAKTRLTKRIDDFKQFEGKLAESADVLYECLELNTEVIKKYYRLSSYASRLYHQDNRESEPQAMQQSISQLGTKLSAALSFIDPEILAMDKATIKRFLETKPELKTYEHYLQDLQRQKDHTLSKKEEKIISEAGIMSGAASDIYGIFKNADMPRPTIEDKEGQQIRLDDSNYALYRASSDRNMRIKVFDEFFGAYKDFERTFGTQLFSQIKKNMFYKNVRKYDSCLQSALDRNNIPTSVYTGLIDNVNKHLPTLHRYLELRKQMLGVDELHYYDMYPSLVKEVDLSYEVAEAQQLIKNALQTLGDQYVATLDQAFNNRWIDMFPTTGKRSGAYSDGSAYDVHPYILMNYNGQYEDVSTLAHELGHTMHSYFSNKNQHFANAHYPIFLAEVASITNEALLIDHVLDDIDDPETRLSILGSQLETFRTTLFRQTQFAEFELKIHKQAEKGEALTGQKFTDIYLDILKKYYGHELNVTVIDDLYGIEWAYIPHFYYNFYVFQYATSLCAATAVSEKILQEGDSMRQRYINDFLSAGGSDYAIPLLKNIGVDMTANEPFELAMKRMNEIMDEIEAILAERQ